MDYLRITSRQNQLVKEASALANSPEKRREFGSFLCEGARLCEDAVRSGVYVKRCFFTAAAEKKYDKYLRLILQKSGENYLIEEHVAGLLSATKHTQGVFCVCEYPKSLSQENLPKDMPAASCVVLENLQDPGNLGTVLRTAEALGVPNVFLLGECCEVLSPKVLRASMGAAFRQTIAVQSSRKELADHLKKQGYSLLAAVPESSAVSVTDIDFSEGLYSVFIGNEGNGLTEETVALCDSKVTVPMGGRAESLNASAAATILMWEMKRKGEKAANG